MDHRKACAAAAEAWQGVGSQHHPRTLVGFDGFVDHIIDVVDKRTGPEAYAALPTIEALGRRVLAAAGNSANFELVVRQTKIGGNGPIMANALIGYGHQVDYVGIVGPAQVDPVFSPLAERAHEVICLGAPAVTDALEFGDGKLMLGKLTPMAAVNYGTLTRVLGRRLPEMLAVADGVATVNWTMTIAMTDIWRRLAAEVLPGLRKDRPWWFVDLADPAKRTIEDLRDALTALQDLQRHVRVVLGLNGSECRQVVTALGGSWLGGDEDTGAARRSAEFIRAKLGISTVMVHLVRSAAVAWEGGGVEAGGFHCARPKLTTGAGDHFNAGFFAGVLAGLPWLDCLLSGGATSGYYVRNGKSPERADVIRFLREPPAA